MPCLDSAARRQLSHLGIHCWRCREGGAGEAGQLISSRIQTSNSLISFEDACEWRAGQTENPNASSADEVVEVEGRFFWEAWLMQGIIIRDGCK